MDTLSNTDSPSAIKLLDIAKSEKNTTFEIVEYKKPRYPTPTQASNLSLQNPMPQNLRQVRIYLNGGGIITYSGKTQFMKGPITSTLDLKLTTSIKGLFSSSGITGTDLTQRISAPYGEIYFDPSFNHFYLLELSNDEIILYEDLFYCCEDTVDITTHINRGITTGLFGVDGLKQPKLSGNGFVVLQGNIPFDEIIIFKLNNETIKVDGNYTLLIKGNVVNKVEKSNKPINLGQKNNESLLHTFSGEGEVWVAPTKYHEPVGS